MVKEIFNKIWKPLNTYWEGTDKKRRTTIIILVAVMAVAIIVASVLLNRKQYVILYKDMESQEAGEVLTKLEEMQVDAKPEGGNTILVPKEQADSLRMQLSAEGYPKSGLNYDLFQNSINFGATDFEKQKYLQFQLQDRLQNSIKTLDVVENAIVTLNIPDNSSFVLKEDKQKASASVILKIKGKESLSQEQIKGIEGLVSKSIPGLNAEEVFIIDSMGRSLKSRGDTQAEIAVEQLELEDAMSSKLKNQVESLLEPVFGVGKISAGVRVSLDFDIKTTESLKFDPITDEKSGIAVSESIESEELNNGKKSGNVGLNANGGAPQYAETNDNDGRYIKENKTTNYEVDQLRETIKKAEGTIKDISVSVLLDDNNLPSNADTKVKEIVAGALGVDKEKIVVQKMAFNAQKEITKLFESAQKAEEVNEQRQKNIYQAAIYGVSALILAAVVILIIRRVRKKGKEEITDMAIFDNIPQNEKDNEFGLEIKRSDKRAVIENSVKKNPELVALLLRNWLREDAG